VREVKCLLELALLLIQAPTAVIVLIIRWGALKKGEAPSPRRRPIR
jgi:hypothetical protein